MDHGRIPMESEMVLCRRMIRQDIVSLSCLMFQKWMYVCIIGYMIVLYNFSLSLSLSLLSNRVGDVCEKFQRNEIFNEYT